MFSLKNFVFDTLLQNKLTRLSSEGIMTLIKNVFHLVVVSGYRKELLHFITFPVMKCMLTSPFVEVYTMRLVIQSECEPKFIFMQCSPCFMTSGIMSVVVNCRLDLQTPLKQDNRMPQKTHLQVQIFARMRSFLFIYYEQSQR